MEIGDGNKISYRMLGLGHPNRQLLVCHETYEVGAGAEQPIAHAAQEAGVIVRGEIELSVNGETQILAEAMGSTWIAVFHIDIGTHVGKEACEIISAVTPPIY